MVRWAILMASKYDEIRDRFIGRTHGSRSDVHSDWDIYDHDGTVGSGTRVKIYLVDSMDESAYDRKLRMLRQLSLTCYACTMCDLGHKYVARSNDPYERDPHVFSNMNPVRVMAVGQNPGWNELCEGTPFVGEAGANFDAELARGGVSRSELYICNANRCYTKDNIKPSDLQRRRCEPFLAMEIGIIKPLLVISLGASAFESLCPGAVFGESFGKLVRSSRYDVPVYAVYHPSPRNLEDPDRAVAFRRQMGVLCGMLRALRKN